MTLLTEAEIATLSPADKLVYLETIEEMYRRQQQRLLWTYFPDEGPLRRELYPRHLEFMAAGKTYKERACIAANRVGKTMMGGFELTLHLTGLYPDWWEGKRFDGPISAWAAGKMNETLRDIVQAKLVGQIAWEGQNKLVTGTGLIPGELIDMDMISWKQGVSDLIDTIRIKHVSGEYSILGLKSYQQGRGSFEGTEKHVIWLDEEPPMDIYQEVLIRTTTTQGIILATFTPLEGYSEVVLSYMENPAGNKFYNQITWGDVPHLTEEDKAAIIGNLLPHQRDARTKGIPTLGSGAIYPVPETDIVVEPFQLPVWWPRGYGMDVGWNRTAAIWGAWDRDNDVLYVYQEHYRGQAEPSVHADAIRARGKWIPGFIDPASRGKSQKDGEQLLTTYCDLGLNLITADNGVESGLLEVWQRLSTGRLKVFSNLQNLFSEYRLYRRDDKGVIVKKNDHLMDALRYLCKSLPHMIIDPQAVSNLAHKNGTVAHEYEPG